MADSYYAKYKGCLVNTNNYNKLVTTINKNTIEDIFI